MQVEQVEPADEAEQSRPPPTIRVAQACGMISAQADCSMVTAIVLFQKRADLIGCSYAALAQSVIARRTSFAITRPILRYCPD